MMPRIARYTIQIQAKTTTTKQKADAPKCDPCKQVRIFAGKEQKEKWNKGDDIPEQIPPETADLPGKMAFKVWNRAHRAVSHS